MWPLFRAEYLRQNCWFWAGTVWSRCSTAPRPPCRHPRRTHQTPTPCSSTGTPQQFQIRIKFMARAGHAPHFSSLRQIQDLDTPRQCDPFPVLKVQHAAAFLKLFNNALEPKKGKKLPKVMKRGKKQRKVYLCCHISHMIYFIYLFYFFALMCREFVWVFTIVRVFYTCATAPCYIILYSVYISQTK